MATQTASRRQGHMKLAVLTEFFPSVDKLEKQGESLAQQPTTSSSFSTSSTRRQGRRETARNNQPNADKRLVST